MRKHFLAPTPRFGTQDKPLPTTYQHRSPYYWWWQYLRRNEDYVHCCTQGGRGVLKSLFEDFGDVRADDFKQWWSTDDKGAYLFAEQPLSVKFSELNNVHQWSSDWSKDDVMVVAVPLEMSKRDLKAQFAKLLDRRHAATTKGRTPLKTLKINSSARYPLERNYTTANLQTGLEVYDLWKSSQSRAESDRLTLWQIGAELKINRSAIRDALSDHKADRAMGRNILGATVNRYLRRAQAIIANTARGKFPLE